MTKWLEGKYMPEVYIVVMLLAYTGVVLLLS